MQIEFLGTGGAVSTPRPGCNCRVCTQARAKGIPYSRTGPSLFIHGPDVLIDTPEESKEQLNRSRIKEINGCFYSHWHPDHVMGRRVWETRNYDERSWPPKVKTTDIYLPEQVARDFKTTLGSWEHFLFLKSLGVVRIMELKDGEDVMLGKTRIRPLRLAEEYVYAFIFEEAGKKVVIAMDELLGWNPPQEVLKADLAIIPMGVVEFNPFTGERNYPPEHPVLKLEATFLQTLEMVKKMNAAKVIMTHIGEPDDLTYDDLLKLEKKLEGEGVNIQFAYDTMMVNL